MNLTKRDTRLKKRNKNGDRISDHKWEILFRLRSTIKSEMRTLSNIKK